MFLLLLQDSAHLTSVAPVILAEKWHLQVVLALVHQTAPNIFLEQH